jgi:hypothetical protein
MIILIMRQNVKSYIGNYKNFKKINFKASNFIKNKKMPLISCKTFNILLKL